MIICKWVDKKRTLPLHDQKIKASGHLFFRNEYLNDIHLQLVGPLNWNIMDFILKENEERKIKLSHYFPKGVYEVHVRSNGKSQIYNFILVSRRGPNQKFKLSSTLEMKNLRKKISEINFDLPIIDTSNLSQSTSETYYMGEYGNNLRIVDNLKKRTQKTYKWYLKIKPHYLLLDIDIFEKLMDENYLTRILHKNEPGLEISQINSQVLRTFGPIEYPIPLIKQVHTYIHHLICIHKF